MWTARYGLKIRQVAHVLGLWPDPLLARGLLRRGHTYRLAEVGPNAWCNGLYRASESVAYISPRVGAILQRRGVPAEKLHYVPMWADERIFSPSRNDLRKELSIHKDAIDLMYAGAVGEAQGLTTLVKACSKIDDPQFNVYMKATPVSSQIRLTPHPSPKLSEPHAHWVAKGFA